MLNIAVEDVVRSNPGWTRFIRRACHRNQLQPSVGFSDQYRDDHEGVLTDSSPTSGRLSRDPRGNIASRITDGGPDLPKPGPSVFVAETPDRVQAETQL